MLQKTNQYMEQTVALGCTISSNPESTINWYKLAAGTTTDNNSQTLDQAEPIYEPIDASSGLKYQVHKYRQANQTVSYLKIKVKPISKSIKKAKKYISFFF